MNFLALFSKKFIWVWMTFSACFLLVASCSSDNEEDLFPAPMVLEDISYANDVTPILSNNCYGCHSSATAVNGGGHILEGYTELQSYVDGGTLLSVIKHEDGVSAMPPFGMLSEIQISTIEIWIEEGALDN